MQVRKRNRHLPSSPSDQGPVRCGEERQVSELDAPQPTAPALASAFACETPMPRSSPVARTGDSSRPARSKSATEPVAQAVAEGFAPVCIAPSLPPVAPPADLPRILFIEQLASLIGKTETTIRTCATNAKYAHLIPRPFKLPNSRRLCWYERDVLQWIESTRPAEPPPPRRPRGRPTKAEQLSRARWAQNNTAQPSAKGGEQ